MTIFPTSAVQFFIVFTMLSVLSWRFYVAFRQTGSIYARYLSFALLFISAPLLYISTISLLLVLQDNNPFVLTVSRWTVGLVWAFHALAFGISAMTASLYFFPKRSPKIAFYIVFFLGLAVAIFGLYTSRSPFITESGIVNWNLNQAANLSYNILNATAFLPLFLLFLVRSITNKVYSRAALIFFGLILSAIIAPLPPQTTDFTSFVLFSLFADIGLACAFSGILLHFTAQANKTHHSGY